MRNTSYFVGCLLTASKNPLNKIQFAVRDNGNGKFSLYSRNSGFHRPFVAEKMKPLGEFNSIEAIARRINSAKRTMKANGISVPVVEVFSVE